MRGKRGSVVWLDGLGRVSFYCNSNTARGVQLPRPCTSAKDPWTSVSCNLQFPLLGVIGVIAGVGGGGRVQGCRGQSDAMQWEGRSEGRR